MTILYEGVDVGYPQGAIDWAKFNKDFAIIRAGYSYYGGGIKEDSQFRANMAGALDNGVYRGVYVYAYDKTPEAAKITANTLCDMLKDEKLHFPVVYDFEDKQYFNSSFRASNTSICEAFLSAVKNRGFYPMLYTFSSFAMSFLDMVKLSEYDFWVADYTGKVTYPGDIVMHQYTCTGRTEGINTDVDMNYCYKDFPAIIGKEMPWGTESSKKGIIERLEAVKACIDDIIKEVNNL